MTRSGLPEVTWHARDTGAVRTLLEAVGVHAETKPDGIIASLPSATLRVAPTTADDRLELADRRAAGPTASTPRSGGGADASPDRPDLIGVAWATVDLERAHRALGAGGSLDAAAVDHAMASLGAIARTVDRRAPALVLLEPTTEGRLAALLARHGEGPVGLWLALASDLGARAAERLDLAGFASQGPWDGVFGDEVLVPGPRIWSPVLLLVVRRRPE
jgi:hypothetical protein